MLGIVAKFDGPSLNGFEAIQPLSVGEGERGLKGPPGLNRVSDLT